MKNRLFQTISVKAPKKNLFDLSHERKMSLKPGYIYPMYLQDVIPGDKFRVKSELFIRLAPMISPMMHNVNVYVHYFFVPMRLLWDEWEDFITGGKDGLLAPTLPQYVISSANYTLHQKGSLTDYLGVPTIEAGPCDNSLSISILPMRAYALIWDEYYRDQNLHAKSKVTKDTVPYNPEKTDIYKLRYRDWETKK